MAKTIRGITVKIGGDTTGLGKALDSVNTKSRDLETELKRVNKLLEADPKNITLLAQKQEILTEAVENTRLKLSKLHEVQEQVQKQFDEGKITAEQYRDFNRELEATKIKLSQLTKEAESFSAIGTLIDAADKEAKELRDQLADIDEQLKFDPTNVELLTKRQELLSEAIGNTGVKLRNLKDIERQVQEQFERGEISEEQYRELQQAISEAENELNHFTFELNSFNTEVIDLDQSLDWVNNSLKQMDQTMTELDNLLKKSPKSVELLSQKQELLAKTADATQEKLELLKQKHVQMVNQLAKGEIGIDEFNALQREIVDTEQKLKDVTKELKNFGSVGIQQAKAVANDMKDAGEKIKNVGDSIENVGDKLTPVSAAAAGALTAVTASAIDFESAWAGVLKTMDMSGENLDEVEKEVEDIRQGILNMSQTTASSASDISAVAEAAGQLGVKRGDILEFTETMVRLGDSTNITADEAASAIAKLYNVMGNGDDFSTVKNFGAAMVDLGNKFATTENDIMNMATRLASAGANIGLTEQEILALATTLSSVGLEAEAGGSAISRVMNDIDMAVALNGETLGTWAELTGLSVDQFKQKWETDAMGALQMVIGGMGDARAGGENLNVILDELGITQIRTSDTMRRLTNASEVMNEAVEVSNKAWTDNKALTDESNKRYETTASKLQQVKGALTEASVALGEVLLPKIKAVLDEVIKWINKFSELDSGTQTVILVIAALVSGLAPVIITIGKVTSAIGTMLTFAPKVVTAFNSIKTVVSTCVTFMKTALSGLFKLILAHPVAAVVAAVVALLIVLYNKCDWFREKVNWVVNKIGEFVRKIPGFFQELPSKVVSVGSDIVRGLWNGISNMASWIKSKITGFGKGVLQNLKDFFGIKSPSRLIADEVGRYISEGMGVGIEENADSPIKATKDVTDDVINAATVNRKLSATFAPTLNAANANSNTAMLAKLDGIYERLSRLQIVLDTGTLIGETIDTIDQRLGERQMLSAMGV